MHASARLTMPTSTIRLGRTGQVGAGLAALALIYWATNQGPARGGPIETHIVQPLLWSGLAALILLLSRVGAHRLSFTRVLLPLALLAGCFHLAVLVICGLLFGFGHTLHSYAPRALTENLTWVLFSLVGLELSRAYLLSTLRSRPVLAVGATALLFTFVIMSLAEIRAVSNPAEGTEFLGERGLPLLSENVLASYLALLGGPLAAITYRGTLQAFEWLSPILPDLPWAVDALAGIGAPAIAFLAVHSVCAPKPAASESTEPARSRLSSSAGWVAVGITGVAMVWFFLGLFPVFPAIATGSSMNPTLHHGDLAIVREVSPDSIDVGDVIRFRKGDRWVIHRVIGVEGEGSNRTFTTKGDSNNIADRTPVGAQAVDGELLFSIPKLGKVSFVLKKLLGLFGQ